LALLSHDELNRLTNKMKEWIIRLDGYLSDRITKAIKERTASRTE
jgi:transcription initiation factor TFIID subunit TAF12